MYKKGGAEVSDKEALFFGITMMSMINSMALVAAIICSINIVGLTPYIFPKIDIFIAVFICGLINCMMFVRKKRYKAIVYIYNRLKKKERILGVFIWILCWILSIALFVIALQKA